MTVERESIFYRLSFFVFNQFNMDRMVAKTGSWTMQAISTQIDKRDF